MKEDSGSAAGEDESTRLLPCSGASLPPAPGPVLPPSPVQGGPKRRGRH